MRRLREILRHDFTRSSALTSRAVPIFLLSMRVMQVMQAFLEAAQKRLPGQLVIFP